MKTKKIKAVAALLLMSMLTSCSLSSTHERHGKNKDKDDSDSSDMWGIITNVTCFSYLEDERLMSFDIADEGYLEIECDVDIGIDSDQSFRSGIGSRSLRSALRVYT